MTKVLSILRWVIAAATVLVTTLLCHQCIDIYLTGNSPQNLVDGVYLSPVFSAEIVADRLFRLAPVLGTYAFLVIAGLVLQFVACPGIVKYPASQPVSYETPRSTGGLRLALAVLALTFIILGVMNGGARDVLVKAINICTECIGLG